MDDKIKSWLEDEESEEGKALLSSTRDMLKLSKDAMSAYYRVWDVIDESFRLKRTLDEKDLKAAARKEPVKLTVPFTYPQIMTFVAYVMLLLNQRTNFYEISGTGPEDAGSPERDAEAVLARDTKKNKWNALVYQVLLDIGRFGIGIVKTSWEEKSAPVFKSQPKPAGTTMAGLRVEEEVELKKEKAVVYQGNKAVSVSPYNFFPDTRLPLTRFQEGEFCASEDMYSIVRLRQLQADGVITNVDKIKNLSALDGVEMELREATRLNGLVTDDMPTGVLTKTNSEGMCVVSEVQRWIVPSKFKIGPEDKDVLDKDRKDPELWVIWVANWKTLLRFEAMDYPHNQFTYDVGQFSADQHRLLNEGLGELLAPIQDVAAFMVNSRVTSVRKMIDNKVIARPEWIEMKDLENRSPVIRTKPGAPMSSIDQFIHQLKLQDVTMSHISADVPMLWQMTKDASGIGDNVMGSYSSGRRDATQARAVNAGAAGRLKTIALVLWETLFDPLAQKMLCNAQAGLSLEEFSKIIGEQVDEARFSLFNKRSQGIVEAYDFKVFDGTSPTEKGFMAQSMQELLLGLFQNPMAMQMLQFPPFRALLTEIATLRGIKHPERFLPPVQPQGVIPINGPTAPGAPAGVGAALPPQAVGGVPQ